MPGSERQSGGYTLVEVLLVVGILSVLAVVALPKFITEMKASHMPGSVRQLRSLIMLTRANAAFDGLRYRIRFPMDDEEEGLPSGAWQPIIEREDDPFDDPETFNIVTAPWAVGKTFLGDVWCAEVRLGRPTVARLVERRDLIEELIEEEFEDFEPERPPLLIDPDGSSDWATFVVTDAPHDIDIEELEEYAREGGTSEDYRVLEVILDGPLGLAWIQRPLYETELDLFEEKNWPVVLRQDFLRLEELTEDDVLELRNVPLPE